MKIIGLTGGIGSGKSTVAACFRDQGIPVIDADSIGHRLLETDPAIRQAILDIFGDSILDADDAIAREKLAEQVFCNEPLRKQLNGILHPAIVAEVGRQCAAHHTAGCEAVIVEAALIGESGSREPWLTGLILVTASPNIRIERLVRFRSFSREDAVRRIAAQLSPERKRVIADWVIDNDGGLEALKEHVLKVAEEIRRMK